MKLENAGGSVISEYDWCCGSGLKTVDLHEY